MTTNRRALLLLTTMAGLLFLPWLGARDLWNPNEPLYGQAVAEMSASGDWLVPTVNGAVFDEKPILYFWMALASSRLLGGVSEFALRLPSAVAGIASVLLVVCLVRPYAGRTRSLLAGLVLATTFVVFWSARQVQMDLLLTACVLAAVFGATRAVDRLWAPAAGWALAGAAAGSGFLAKGPVGLVLPAGVALVYAIATRRTGEVLRPSIVLGVLAFVVVAVPWYAFLWARGETAFLDELLVRQNLLRFVEPWDHQAPWWYFLKYFWIDMAPWAWFVPLAWGLRPTSEHDRRLHRLAWSWLLFVVVFFSLSASKRSPYILPAAPAVAVLVAGVAERWLVGDLGAWRERAARAIAAAFGVALLVGAIVLAAGSPWIDSPGPGTRAAIRTMVAVLGVGGALVVVAALMGRRRRGLAAGTLLAAIAAAYLGASATALPEANRVKSHRALCQAIRSHVPDTAPLRGFHEWQWRASYSFYTGRPIPNLEGLDELREYWLGPERVFVIVEQGRLDEARRVLGPVAPLASGAVGHNVAYLFSSRDE